MKVTLIELAIILVLVHMSACLLYIIKNKKSPIYKYKLYIEALMYDNNKLLNATRSNNHKLIMKIIRFFYLFNTSLSYINHIVFLIPLELVFSDRVE